MPTLRFRKYNRDAVGEHHVVWWRWVGAVPVCPPVSPYRGAAIVKFPAHNACVFGMETSLRGRSGGHTGASPTVSFGQITCGRLVSFVWIVREWLFCLCGIARKCITEIGRGGASVPARVAPQGRIHRSIPRAQCVHFWYGNAAARTFGRAHRHRPYGFVWVDCAWTVDAVLGIAHGGSV